MKKTSIILVTLFVLAGLFAIQSCQKDESGTPAKVYLAAVPGSPVPANSGVVPFTAAGQTVNLTWTGTATNAISWDVYFGSDAAPANVATGITTNAYSVTVPSGGTYYWQIVTVDANNVKSTSPVWQFEVNSNPNAPVLTAPANNATAVSKTGALTWTCTDPEKDDLTFDVFIGTSSTPAIVATGISTLTYSPTLAYNTTYYWQIVAHDPYGGVSTSAVNTFKTDIIHPDYAVFNGTATELAPSISATKLENVTIQRIGTSNLLAITLPLANAMVDAGWGTVYTGTHPIFITYDPVTLAVTSDKQAWCDSFIDPKEMGPMFLQVASGTIDATTKKISIKWIVSGNAYWGADANLATSTYTMK